MSLDCMLHLCVSVPSVKVERGTPWHDTAKTARCLAGTCLVKDTSHSLPPTETLSNPLRAAVHRLLSNTQAPTGPPLPPRRPQKMARLRRRPRRPSCRVLKSTRPTLPSLTRTAFVLFPEGSPPVHYATIIGLHACCRSTLHWQCCCHCCEAAFIKSSLQGMPGASPAGRRAQSRA